MTAAAVDRSVVSEPEPIAILSVCHLAKTIGQKEKALPIIADIDFSVSEGEFCQWSDHPAAGRQRS
jgi:predicted ABC-type transport system involved in lysophospholipase L1 biosynthesis ATPase subunit